MGLILNSRGGEVGGGGRRMPQGWVIGRSRPDGVCLCGELCLGLCCRIIAVPVGGKEDGKCDNADDDVEGGCGCGGGVLMVVVMVIVC